ncbi:MAG TPA: MFS transporter [Thermomicrobiales bacterium]|nr:MFS transporter [Thermomicrobiales bacterium]
MLMPVYVPTALLAFGQGMLVPTLPFYAKDLGASGSLIGLIVAAAGLGTLATDLPAGIVIGRLGRRPAMLMGAGLVAISTIIAGLWANVPGLILLRLLAGAGTALWALSRHAYITDVTQPAQRGRSIAVFGGINRAGSLLAPALGGALGKLFGLGAPFIVAGILAAGTAGIAFIFVPETGGSSQFKAGHKMRWGLVRGMLRTNWRDISAAGSAQVFAQIIRSGRQLVIPLYGSAIGLDVLTVGGIVSAAAALDVSMFLPAGFLMDRFGRKVAAVPSFLVMALGMLLVARAADYQGLLLAASVIGFGNGLGSGTMMTLGADLAPPGAVGEFLGIWRLIGDTGQSAGPLIVGPTTEALGAAASAILLSGVGLLAALTLAILVRETNTTRRPAVRQT